MAIFPIFLVSLLSGIMVGIAFTNLYYYNKKTTPSETQFRIQEAEIIKYKNDIELLQKTNDKLRKEIGELENLLNNK